MFKLYIIITVLFSVTSSIAQNYNEIKLNNALSSLQNNKHIRLISEELGPISGLFLNNNADTLILGIKKDAKVNEPRRKLNYKPRYKTPKWIPVKNETNIPHSSIKEIYTGGRATVTGAIVGGAVFCVGSVLLTYMAHALESQRQNTSGDVAIISIGTTFGTLLGAGIGALIPKWNLKYRERGYHYSCDKITISPYLTLETESNNNENIAFDINNVKVQIGFDINWW